MRAFSGLSLMALWANGTSKASAVPPATGFVVEVPFGFVVGTGSFSAGTYRFEASHNPTPGVCVLGVRGEDGRVYKLAVSASASASQTHDRSKLVFHQQGGKHFLTEAWIEGRQLGLQLYRSIQDLDRDQENPNNEVILLVEPDKFGRTVYVIEDCGCTA